MSSTSRLLIVVLFVLSMTAGAVGPRSVAVALTVSATVPEAAEPRDSTGSAPAEPASTAATLATAGASIDPSGDGRWAEYMVVADRGAHSKASHLVNHGDAEAASWLISNSESGAAGKVINYTVTKFNVDGSKFLCVKWNNEKVISTANAIVGGLADGQMSGSFVVPAGYTGTTYTIYFYFSFTAETCEGWGTGRDDFSKAVQFTYIPVTISTTPSSGIAGQSVDYTLTGVEHYKLVCAYWNNDLLVNEINPLALAEYGGSFALPSGYTGQSYPLRFKAIYSGTRCDEYGTSDLDQTVSKQFRLDPSVAPAFTRGPAGTIIAINLASFSASMPVAVLWRGAAIPISISTDSQGVAAFKVTIPAGTATGAGILKFSTGSLIATTTFTVTAASVQLAFPSGQPGYAMGFTLAGFANSASVKIRWDGTQIKTGTTNANGGLQSTFTIPSSATVGQHSVSFVSAGTTRSVTITVKRPTATIAKSSGVVSASIAYSIANFPPNATVKILFGGTLVASVPTNASGAASGQLSVPAKPTGTYKIVWKTAQWSATKSFSITATASTSAPIAMMVTALDHSAADRARPVEITRDQAC